MIMIGMAMVLGMVCTNLAVVWFMKTRYQPSCQPGQEKGQEKLYKARVGHVEDPSVLSEASSGLSAGTVVLLAEDRRKQQEEDEKMSQELQEVEHRMQKEIGQIKALKEKVTARVKSQESQSHFQDRLSGLGGDRLKDFVEASHKIDCAEEDWLNTFLSTHDHRPVGVGESYKSSIKTELKKFHGDLLEWRGFMDMFYGLVHNTNKPAHEKLGLLKQYVGDEPYRLIKHVTGGESAYARALSLLQKRYGNKTEQRRIFKQTLYKLPKVAAEDYKGLQRFTDEVRGLLAGLNGDKGIDADEVIAELADKLPRDYRSQWRAFVRTLPDPTMEIFSEWLEDLAMSYRDLPLSNWSKQQRGSGESSKTGRAFSTATDSSCSVCGKEHKVASCPDFQKMTGKEKFQVAKKKRLCFTCLGSGHRCDTDECPRKGKRCGQDGCTGNHHVLLHHDKKAFHAVMAHSTCSSISFGVVKVLVSGTGGREISALAMIDNTSDTTLVSDSFRKKAGLKLGKSCWSTVSGVGSMKTKNKTHPVKMVLKPESGGKSIELSGWTIKQVAGQLDSVPWTEIKGSFDHLKDLPLVDVSGVPDILIGLDNIDVHKAIEVRCGVSGEPYAERTCLGWIVRGPTGKNGQKSGTKVQIHHVKLQLPELAERFFDGERFGTEARSKFAHGEKKTDRILEGITKLEGPGYQAKLPWKEDAPPIGNNFPVAEKRLKATVRKCNRDQKYKKDFETAMQKYIDAGYVEKAYSYDPRLPQTADERREQNQYFLPTHGVYKSEGSKMRIVFDSKAEMDGVSFNDRMETGDKKQSNAPDNLTRFREREVAYVSDVEAMFSRIRLTPEDARLHRFLYQRSPTQVDVMQMNRVSFGDGASPCIAITVLRKTADDFGGDKEEVKETIQKGFYMDDLLDSVMTVQEANKKAKEISDILKQGDFHLRHWVSNKDEFDLMEAEEREAVEVKVLGLWWNRKKDTLRHVTDGVNLKVEMTKRALLGETSGVFQPLGLLAPVIVKAKIKMSLLHLLGLDWDDDLEKKSKSVKEESAEVLLEEINWWRKWLQILKKAGDVEFPRCLQSNHE